jgi:hypothetical protein
MNGRPSFDTDMSLQILDSKGILNPKSPSYALCSSPREDIRELLELRRSGPYLSYHVVSRTVIGGTRTVSVYSKQSFNWQRSCVLSGLCHVVADETHRRSCPLVEIFAHSPILEMRQTISMFNQEHISIEGVTFGPVVFLEHDRSKSGSATAHIIPGRTSRQIHSDNNSVFSSESITRCFPLQTWLLDEQHLVTNVSYIYPGFLKRNRV